MNLSTMFCFKGISKSDSETKFRETSKQDEFGWWLSDEDVLKSSRSTRSKDCQSLESSDSMVSCVDSDDSESYVLAQDFKQDYHDGCEKIELTTLIHGDMDVNSIEQDAVRSEEVTPYETTRCSNDMKAEKPQGVCYTPERLIRSQEYRILAPSPPMLSISQTMSITRNENPQKVSRCRRRLNYLIDSKQVDAAKLKAFLDPISKEAPPTISLYYWDNYKRNQYSYDVKKKHENQRKSENIVNVSDRDEPNDSQITISINKTSSCEKLNTWEDCKKMRSRSSSCEDTSGIQSNDWSSDTHSDLQNTPISLCDELAASNYKLNSSQEPCCAVNEVVSILEVLDTNPEKATVLLEEDRFRRCSSSHDQLTRLALTIETDSNVPGDLENPGHLVQRLQNKVKTLEANSKDIFRDISDLRKSFQSDEQKMTDISIHATKLREEVQELRYFDDLLVLLRGELERISKRNWPFVVGRRDHHPGEMNLIV